MDQRMERMSKMMHCMSGFESRPAMKEPEMQQQMNQMRRQMDGMIRDPSMKSPAAFQKLQQAQGELSGALSRLLVVSENYPNLRANQGFRDLQAQLEGTENRIAVARNRHIKSVQDYNVTVRAAQGRFPGALVTGGAVALIAWLIAGTAFIAMARMNCSTSPWCFSVNRENHIRRVCGVTAAGAASRTAALKFLIKENPCSSTF